jgi:hypothetical protein
MKKLKMNDVISYVESNIQSFHLQRLQSLNGLKLKQVLARKNPYLYKAKNVTTAEQIIKSIVDAHISSNEETIFGDWLEGLAIFINHQVYGGIKSGIKGIDLEFDHEGVRYIVTIKSGPNWGNSSQISKMKSDFNTAKKTIRTSNNRTLNIVAVNGCCYGKDNQPDKGDHFKFCGQKFWEFISGEPDLFLEIIEPLGINAKERNAEFDDLYSQRINLFTYEFSKDYMNKDGAISWEKLVRFNSGAAMG